MSDNKRQFYRISGYSINAELQESVDITILNISLGGAKFKINNELFDLSELQEPFLYLDLGGGTTFNIPFEIKEQKGTIYRVHFFKMPSNIEAALARYILKWQQKRAYLARVKRKTEDEK